ncbi:hypothetical protein PV325_002480 [Microctonus aethiopoides]|uniref:MI domain-containing protein n=1 Tax=Microctonus aethiopoides TaxID=144406 RepID=A0AA39FX49_9HYME|nr:hypothetical protein PV325_002480 [Microctonus aethiopoides]KAK0091761.1 hypothetical protein PV326_002730 [Microctonus aethiopoides]KAK0177231.1 hypothetical protein PV328_001307 [Microctonus aethiopoides]
METKTVAILTSRTGSAHIPHPKLKLMQPEFTDKIFTAYQKVAWEALKKSIHGYIDKINISNIGIITRELLRENIIRGRGLLTKSIIQAQVTSPTFTPVYAALAAAINAKFPNIGELLLKRLVIQFKQGFKRNDKPLCISSGTFIAHLVNQRVADEILAFEMLTLLVNAPTDDSIEVAIAFLKECGTKLAKVSTKDLEAIFEMLRHILHEGQLDKRVQYMIEVMFQIHKDGFKNHETIPKELTVIGEEDQFTHLITLNKAIDSQDILNVFIYDDKYVENEERYAELMKSILHIDGSSESGDEDDDNFDEDTEEKSNVIVNSINTNFTSLRRIIYLTIHSSLDFEECAHKLMKMQLKPGQEMELCHMILDCCVVMRTYGKFFGLLAGRFCERSKLYMTSFEKIFKNSYDTIHRLDIIKLHNVSKFFAHLLYSDSISWCVLSNIKLNEQETTSSTRIFIKILFQELSEYMGLTKLNARVKDSMLQEAFEGLFPRNDPKKHRFAINFFTSIGLGGLIDDLCENLKTPPKSAQSPPIISTEAESSSSSSSFSSNNYDEPDDEERKKQKRKSKKKSYKHRNVKQRKTESSRRIERQKTIKEEEEIQ